MKNERPDLWDGMLLGMSCILIVHSVLAEERLDALSASVRLMQEEQASRIALVEAQLDGCATTMVEWEKWLQIRRDQWGSAWFVEMKEEKADD